MVLILGLIDDRVGIDPMVRLGVELLAAVVLVLSVTANPGIVFMVLSVALAVFAINSVNLFDGLDGLVGSVGLVTAAGLAVIARGRGLDFASPLELGAALGGFLVLNWHPARVFMGDAGTYFLGLYLTHLIIDSTNESAMELVFMAGVLGVFAIDMLVTLLRRRLNHRPLLLGDRSHIYDQLRDRGVGVPGHRADRRRHTGGPAWAGNSLRAPTWRRMGSGDPHRPPRAPPSRLGPSRFPQSRSTSNLMASVG